MSPCCFLIYHSGSCSGRERLTLSERQQLLAQPDLPVFTGAVFEHPSGVLCTQPSQTLLSGKFGRHHSTVSHSWSVFSSLTTQMKEELMRQSSFPLTPLLHFTVTALLSSTKSPSFPCSECGRMQQFHSTFNNTQTGI